MASASRATGNATSSMITVVPVARTAPTLGNVPLRTFQYLPMVSASVLKCSGSTVAMPASPCSIAAMWAASAATLSARVSTSSAAASGPSARSAAGMPPWCSTLASAGRSISSTAATGSAASRVTASQALRSESNRISAAALSAWSGTVR